MTWIICEGLDRSGKSTVAEIYKQQGYEVIHLSAPDKKYSQPGYSGPSYLDEMIELYVSKTGKDVFWDRSAYGELIWSHVYNRPPQLSEEDFEVLKEIEQQNDTQYVLMHDPNTEEHWNRCVQNKEPLTKVQFIQAGRLYNATLVYKYSFVKHTLLDYVKPPEAQAVEAPSIEEKVAEKTEDIKTVELKKAVETDLTPEQKRLLQANTINDILSTRIIKKKGNFYDVIENKIRTFLNSELSNLIGMTTPNPSVFSEDEILFLKTLIKQAHKKK
jgi:hypothetical protein